MAKDADNKRNALFALTRPSRCHSCDLKLNADEIVKLNTTDNEEKEVFCLKCSGLSQMELLRSGNAALTRLAKKYSAQHFVVMKWSEIWKTYERQGLLVESEALSRAKKEAATK